MELTIAEQEVAALAGSGLTNKQIARLRHSTEKTVKNQLNAIYDKGVFGVNRNELCAAFRLQRTDQRTGAQDGRTFYRAQTP